MASNNEHLAQRRREILAAAGKVFDAKGYAATTVDEVAEAAGVSKGSMYNYFESKQELFFEVFADVLASQEASVDELMAQPLTGEQKLKGVLAFWFGQFDEHKHLGRLMLEFWATAARQKQDGRLASWFNQMYTRWRGRIVEMLQQGIDEGQFRKDFDPTIASALILAILDGITVQAILDMGLNVDQEFVAALERSIFAALTGKVPPRPIKA